MATSAIRGLSILQNKTQKDHCSRPSAAGGAYPEELASRGSSYNKPSEAISEHVDIKIFLGEHAFTPLALHTFLLKLHQCTHPGMQLPVGNSWIHLNWNLLLWISLKFEFHQPLIFWKCDVISCIAVTPFMYSISTFYQANMTPDILYFQLEWNGQWHIEF